MDVGFGQAHRQAGSQSQESNTQHSAQHTHKKKKLKRGEKKYIFQAFCSVTKVFAFFCEIPMKMLHLNAQCFPLRYTPKAARPAKCYSRLDISTPDRQGQG